MLSFKPTLESFPFIKRLFSSYSLSAIRVVSSAYLKLLIFLLAILIPASALANPAFPMMYSAYKLNKQGDNIQPWHALFPFWNQSIVPCPVLTVSSWSAYSFLKRQVRWSGNYSHFIAINLVRCFLHNIQLSQLNLRNFIHIESMKRSVCVFLENGLYEKSLA